MRVNSTEDVPSVTEAEYDEMQEQYDEWLMGVTHSNSQLHVQYCQALQQKSTENLRRKGIKVFPYEYYDVCDYCLVDHREGEVDHSSINVIEKNEPTVIRS